MSQDGEAWGRVEGADSSGACVVAATDGGFVAHPAVLFVEDPAAAKPNGQLRGMFKMLYVEGDLPEGEGSRGTGVKVALSEDGFEWTRSGREVLPLAGSGLKSVGRLTVERTRVFDEGKEEWRDGEGFTMFFDGEDGDGRVGIYEAATGTAMAEDDGWIIKEKPALAPAEEGSGSFDEAAVRSPAIVRLESGEERLYYTGVAASGEESLGVATRRGEGEWERVNVGGLRVLGE